MMKFHSRLTAFLRSIYLINLDQYSPAIPTLRRQKNNLNCPPFFRNFNPIRRLRVARNLSNQFSGVQISCDICTCLEGYLYTTKQCWIIKSSTKTVVSWIRDISQCVWVWVGGWVGVGAKDFIESPEGNSKFCFPRISM